MRMFGKGRADRRTCHRTYLFDSPLRGRRYEAGLYSPDRCDGRQIEYIYIDWADTEEYYNPDMEKYNLGRQEFWTPENKAKYLEIAKETGMKSVRTRAGRLPVCISAIRLPLPIISLRCISRAMPTGTRSIRPANRSTTCSGCRCGVGNRGTNTGPRFFAARGWIGSGRNICR